MRRLRDLQEVDVHVGTRVFPARVLMLHGSTAVITGEAYAQTQAGRLPATVSFTSGGTLVSLEGRLAEGPLSNTTLFTAVGTGHMPDQRARPRLRVRLAARVGFPDDPGRDVVDATVRDISESGIGLDGVVVDPGTRIVVHVRQDGTSLRLAAIVRRRTVTGLGAELTESPPQLATTIVNALLARR